MQEDVLVAIISAYSVIITALAAYMFRQRNHNSRSFASGNPGNDTHKMLLENIRRDIQNLNQTVSGGFSDTRRTLDGCFAEIRDMLRGRG